VPDAADRKRRGAWYTPEDLVATVVGAAIGSRLPTRIVDPACGDGRFLLAAARRVLADGGVPQLVGVDSDPGAVEATTNALRAEGLSFEILLADALTLDWSELGRFDLVIGNPPFLSQMATATSRGGASRRGGGPYADAAVEFLALAGQIAEPAGGRVAFVLPQSLLSARDAQQVRASIDDRAELIWSWWTGERVFDAQVLTCALVFEFGRHAVSAGSSASGSPTRAGDWTHVVTARSGIPDVPALVEHQHAGTLGDRCRLNANFRDEYYGMVPAVGDHPVGPQLITSGLIDPGRSLWGERQIRFAKRKFERPRIDLAALGGKMPKWAADRLVPKVLIANQTKILEALADPEGIMLPGVPVVAAYPHGSDLERPTWEIAAVLTSPIASAWAWHRSAGTGMSADAIRIGPVLLADLPWPGGALDEAIGALRDHDVRGCAAEVHRAYGVQMGSESDNALTAWWTAALSRIEERQPANVTTRVRCD
jgi:SAM-dependent methyltransferase